MIPTCDSPLARSAVADAVENNAVSNLATLRLLDMQGVQEIKSNATQRLCQATLVLNSGSQQTRYLLSLSSSGETLVQVGSDLDIEAAAPSPAAASNSKGPGPVAAGDTAQAQGAQAPLLVRDNSIAFDPFTWGTAGQWQSLSTIKNGADGEAGRLFVSADRSLALLVTYQGCGTSCGDQGRMAVYTIIFNRTLPLPKGLQTDGEYKNVAISVGSQQFTTVRSGNSSAGSVGDNPMITFNYPNTGLEDSSPWSSATCSTALQMAMVGNPGLLSLAFSGARYSFPIDPEDRDVPRRCEP